MTFQAKSKQQGEDKRDFDTTSLHANASGQTVHRDYAAHFFRWGFARRFIKHHMRVLDIGCGPEQPLARVLGQYATSFPREMVMVDYGNVKKQGSYKWVTLYPKFNFTTRWRELYPQFDVITCFEVIEHMQLAHGRRLLRGARELLKPDGTFLLSCPVFDPRVGMARNHINEMTVAQLQKEVERAGLKIERRFGTFQTALQAKQARPEHYAIWRALNEYYSTDVLACFLAPLYPDHARNNIWVLKKKV